MQGDDQPECQCQDYLLRHGTEHHRYAHQEIRGSKTKKQQKAQALPIYTNINYIHYNN